MFFFFVVVFAFFSLRLYFISPSKTDTTTAWREQKRKKVSTEILKYLSHLVDHISHHFHYVARGERGLCATQDTSRYECVKKNDKDSNKVILK